MEPRDYVPIHPVALVAVLHHTLHAMPDATFAALGPVARWRLDPRRARALFEERFTAGATRKDNEDETSTK
jgi:hypothetical protein